MASYPFVDWGKLGDNFWPMVKYGVIRGVGKHFRTDPNARNTIIKQFTGAVFDSMYTLGDQQFKTRWQESAPKIAAWQEFARSPAKLRYVYTVETVKNGQTYEVPLYIQSPTDPDPTDDNIRTTLDHVRDNRESPYNGQGRMTPFYRGDFSLIAAEKFTREDFKRLQDPEAFRRWFVMDECWNMQQFGDVESTGVKTDSNGMPHTVRQYGPASKWRKWLYWTGGDIVYDFVDAPFDPLQRYAESVGLPSDAQQILIKNEYKMIARIRRSLFRNSSRNPLDFDLTD